MIHLILQLADGTDLDTDMFSEQIRDTDALTQIMNQNVLVNAATLQWIDAPEPFQIAEENNEEIDDEGGGYLPYDDCGELIRDLDPEEQNELDEDDYYYHITKAEWVGKSDYEGYVANWMNENHDAYRDMITHGCETGMMSDLIYHSQVMEHLKTYKREIEYVVQEIADDLGDMGFLFGQTEYNKRDFSFDRLVWMCFEETVRNTLRQLDLEDI